MKPVPSRTDEPASPAHGGWMFPVLLAAVLVVSAVIAFTGGPPASRPALGPLESWTPSERPAGESVALEIDFGNGAKKEFAALLWREGMTVADLLEEARTFRPGIEFTQQGAGAGGFLTALDGLKNQGASGRNWRYKVDGKNADESFCLAKLSPGARVLWEFTDEQ